MLEMKTKLTISSLFFSSFFMPLANAEDGQIEFKGKIISEACTVDTNSQKQTVDMGTINTSALNAVNKTAGAARFTIKLTNCPGSISGASARFDGQLDAKNKNYLALNNADNKAAQGVAIGIYENDSNTLIPMGTTSKSNPLGKIKGSSADLDFMAKYVATLDPAGITAGSANAVANFTIVYN
ncbi:MAG: type 1 fimbrial protein [Enterobacteriaceae bacterium]|jgi:major type 1 subunit fimbrin (pilin)|nr:type 1 fimbrial protein [Enterobacteriaceae bacterium]